MVSTHDYQKDSRNKNIKIYIDGKYYSRSEAKVSVFESGFLLGDGVWEGLRLHNGSILHLNNHLERLYNGAKLLDIKLNLSKKDLKQILFKTINLNEMYTDVHIRLIISRGIKSTPYQSPAVTIGDPTLVVIPEFKKVNYDSINKGIKIATVKTIRDSRVQNHQINSLSKHNCIAACIEASKLEVDEALMLDPHGFVSTCNSTNFFMVKNREVWTSKGLHCLKGITRQAVIRICKQNKIIILEKNFKVSDVHDSDEAFVTGTFAGIIPVIEVDGIEKSNNRMGNITRILQDLYKIDMAEHAVN